MDNNGDREFTGDALYSLVIDIEGAVGKHAAGCTPLGMAVTQLAEEAWKKDQSKAKEAEASK